MSSDVANTLKRTSLRASPRIRSSFTGNLSTISQGTDSTLQETPGFHSESLEKLSNLETNAASKRTTNNPSTGILSPFPSREILGHGTMPSRSRERKSPKGSFTRLTPSPNHQSSRTGLEILFAGGEPVTLYPNGVRCYDCKETFDTERGLLVHRITCRTRVRTASLSSGKSILVSIVGPVPPPEELLVNAEFSRGDMVLSAQTSKGKDMKVRVVLPKKQPRNLKVPAKVEKSKSIMYHTGMGVQVEEKGSKMWKCSRCLHLFIKKAYLVDHFQK